MQAADDDAFVAAERAANEDPIGLLVEDPQLSAFQNALFPRRANGDIDRPEPTRALGECRQGKPKARLVHSPGDFQARQVAATNAVEGHVKGEHHIDAAGVKWQRLGEPLYRRGTVMVQQVKDYAGGCGRAIHHVHLAHRAELQYYGPVALGEY